MYFFYLIVSLAVLHAKADDEFCYNPFPTSCDCTNDLDGQGSILECNQDTLSREVTSSTVPSTTQSYDVWTTSEAPDYGTSNSSYAYTQYDSEATVETTAQETLETTTEEPTIATNETTTESSNTTDRVKFFYHSYYGSRVKQMNVNKVQSLTERDLFQDLTIGTLYLANVTVLDKSVFGYSASIQELVIASQNLDSMDVTSAISKLTFKGVPCAKVAEILANLTTSYIQTIVLTENGCTDFNFNVLANFTYLYSFEFSNQNIKSFNTLSLRHNTLNALTLSSVSQTPFNLTSYQFDLPVLSSLDLSNNQIEYIEQNWFVNFYNSLHMDLSGIPGLDLSSYQNLPYQLASLRISQNNLVSLPDLSKYTGLSTLDVSFNNIDYLNHNVLSSPYISFLNASNNSIFYVDWNLNKTIGQIDLRGNRLFSLLPFNKIKQSSLSIDLSDQEQLLSNGIQINDYNLRREVDNNGYDPSFYYYSYYDSYVSTKLNLMGNKLDISSKYPFCGTSTHYDKYGRRQTQTWELYLDDLNIIDNPCLFNQFFSHDNTTSVTFITREPVNCVLKALLDMRGINVLTYPNQQHLDFNYNHIMYEKFMYEPNMPVALDYYQVCNGSDYQAAAHIFSFGRLECDEYKCPDWL